MFIFYKLSSGDCFAFRVIRKQAFRIRLISSLKKRVSTVKSFQEDEFLRYSCSFPLLKHFWKYQIMFSKKSPTGVNNLQILQYWILKGTH